MRQVTVEVFNKEHIEWTIIDTLETLLTMCHNNDMSLYNEIVSILNNERRFQTEIEQSKSPDIKDGATMCYGAMMGLSSLQLYIIVRFRLNGTNDLKEVMRRYYDARQKEVVYAKPE